jgi:serine/threonine-protein kinase HipA
VIFNYLIGNADAHAKNLSFLITRDGVTLAPFYDLVSTAIYRDLTDKFALKIGGENRPDWTRKRHWEQFAKISGANPRVVWFRIAALSKAILDVATETARQLNLENQESAMVAKILGVIETRSKHLKHLR